MATRPRHGNGTRQPLAPVPAGSSHAGRRRPGSLDAVRYCPCCPCRRPPRELHATDSLTHHPPQLPSRPPSPHTPWSGRGSGRQGGARRCTNDLDALGRDRSALPGSAVDGMGTPRARHYVAVVGNGVPTAPVSADPPPEAVLTLVLSAVSTSLIPPLTACGIRQTSAVAHLFLIPKRRLDLLQIMRAGHVMTPAQGGARSVDGWGTRIGPVHRPSVGQSVKRDHPGASSGGAGPGRAGRGQERAPAPEPGAGPQCGPVGCDLPSDGWSRWGQRYRMAEGQEPSVQAPRACGLRDEGPRRSCRGRWRLQELRVPTVVRWCSLISSAPRLRSAGCCGLRPG